MELKLELGFNDYGNCACPLDNFPILAGLCRNHDNYIPLECSPRIRRIMRAFQKRSSKTAEMVGVLIAMAQKQATRFARDDSIAGREKARRETISVSLYYNPKYMMMYICLRPLLIDSFFFLCLFQPIMFWVNRTSVRFVRAHIPCAYLEALEYPTLPLREKLVVEMTKPFDILNEADRAPLLCALAAIIDDYYLKFRPENLAQPSSD